MDWFAPLRQVMEFALPILDRVPFLRAALGTALVFFLPGFAWTLVFFSRINWFERIVFSLGLSIAVVTLSILAFNLLLGVSITGLNSLLIILIVTIIPVAFHYLKRAVRGKGGKGASPEST